MLQAEYTAAFLRGAPPADCGTEDLCQAYRAHGDRLADPNCPGELRWLHTKQLASLRVRLKEAGVPAHALAIGTNSSDDALRSRCDYLLRRVVALFRDPVLATCDLQPAMLTQVLRRRCSWEASFQRMREIGHAAVQEDALVQELRDLAEFAGREDVLEALSCIRLMRARDNALAVRQALGADSFEEIFRSGPAFSLGVGLCQFEDLIVRESNASMTVCDSVAPLGSMLDSRIRYVDGTAERIMEELAPGAIAVFVIKDALHHFADSRNMLALCARKLHHRGSVVLIEPYFEDGDHEGRAAMRELDGTEFKDSICSRRRLTYLINCAGLRVSRALHLAPSRADNNDCFPRILYVLSHPHSVAEG